MSDGIKDIIVELCLFAALIAATLAVSMVIMGLFLLYLTGSVR